MTVINHHVYMVSGVVLECRLKPNSDFIGSFGSETGKQGGEC